MQVSEEAKKAAVRIYNDLSDRYGIRQELEICSDEVKKIIRDSHTEIIQAAIDESVKPERERARKLADAIALHFSDEDNTCSLLDAYREYADSLESVK